VPWQPHRSRLARLLAPLAIGVVAFIGIGSVAAGPAVAPGPALAPGSAVAPGPSPTGAVAAATDADPAPGSILTPGTRPTSLPPLPFANVRDRSDGAPPLSGLTGYRWPLAKARLTLPFGPTPWGSRIVDGVRFHDGVDLATFCGDRIVAAHGGIVIAAGRHYDDAMGWLGDLTPYYARLDAKSLWSTLPIVVVIDDGNGYRSVYAHFAEIVVKKGQALTAGTLLGYEGRTGRASGCHLHYDLFSPDETGSFAMDPAVVKRMKLPTAEIARVDPLLVLPDRPKPTARQSASPKPSAETSPSPAP
jgi:murein DD-endopeptidase MepM/ murein hydrolase activator NlpD